MDCKSVATGYGEQTGVTNSGLSVGALYQRSSATALPHRHPPF